MSEQKLSGRELAAMEMEAAKTLELGDKKWYLLAAVALYVISLALPHIRGVAGWQVLFFTDTASEAGIRLAEYVFYVLGAIGVFFFTLGALTLKRMWMAWVAWIFSCVTLVYAVLAAWMRQTSTSTDNTFVHIGMLVATVAAIAAVWGLSTTILARSDHQLDVARMRAENTELSAVESAQKDLLRQQQNDPETNPLLVDDRRARIARRRNAANGEQEETETQGEPDKA